MSDQDDHLLASRLARRAGDVLLAVRQELADAEPADRRAAGDRRSQEFLSAELTRSRPADAVLSEEAVDDRVRLGADRVWIIDPLDGTREFGEADRTDWAVHVALWENGELAAGAVALPALGETPATPGIRLLDRRRPGGPRVVVSRTRPQAVAVEIAEKLGGSLVEMGSAGAKAMSIVRGETDIYFHAGGQYEWDSAAPVAVARAAGLHTSRIDGRPLRYNREDPLLPDLLICRPEFAQDTLAIIAGSGGIR